MTSSSNRELLSQVDSEPLRLVLAQILENQYSTQETLNRLNENVQDMKERIIKIETRQEDWKPQIDNIGGVIEKVGELKNWRQIALIVIAALASGFLGWILRGGRP